MPESSFVPARDRCEFEAKPHYVHATAMRTFGVVLIALGIFSSIDSVLQFLGTMPGSGGTKWTGPVLLLSGSLLLFRSNAPNTK